MTSVNTNRNPVVLMPAYRPGPALIEVVDGLTGAGISAIVIVDDGSGPEFASLFETAAALPKVTVLRHAVNLGKGAALKTGINYILCHFPEAPGIITADADGQHATRDIVNVCRRFQHSPESLVLGVRCFSSEPNRTIPLRSRLGNSITRGVMRVVLGTNLTDTQTGLRAIPRALALRLLKITASGYEFELEMLIAAKHLSLRVIQQPIETIYEAGNPSSHFEPLRDSMRIYFVLLRFSLIAVLTAALDNMLFNLLFAWTHNLVAAQAGARVVAVLFNYSAVRRSAFLSQEPHQVLLPRYLALVTVNAIISCAGIRYLTGALPMDVWMAKLLAESVLFIANFVIQRDFVFTRKESAARQGTDWDRYYQSVPPTARLTRRYSLSILQSVLRRFASGCRDIVEIGGANSCFLEGIVKTLHPSAYHVIDRNEYGLSLLERCAKDRPGLKLHHGDVLALDGIEVEADVVFSVGLIEHFDRAGTRKAIATHFDLLRKGGCAIMSFPTPTMLYSAIRAICEMLGVWSFPDERPLRREEVLAAVRGLGEVVFEKTLWPLLLTQHMVVVKKS